MNFIEQNRDLIKAGLIARYSNPIMEAEQSRLYLTPKQIDGIIDYIDGIGSDVDIELFIDETILCFNGFDENGNPLEDFE